MGYKRRNNGSVGRKEAVAMDDVVKAFIRSMRWTSGINRPIVFDAWNEVSGAGRYTVSQFFRNGVLYCTMSSSVVRNRLYFMKEDLIKLMNDKIAANELFINDGKGDGYVKEIVLK